MTAQTSTIPTGGSLEAGQARIGRVIMIQRGANLRVTDGIDVIGDATACESIFGKRGAISVHTNLV